MTQLAEAPEVAKPLRPRPSRAAIAEHVAGLGAPVLAVTYLAHGTGGRDLRPLLVTVVLTAVAAVVLRVWRLPRLALALATWLIAASVVVAVCTRATPDPLGVFYRWRMPGGYALAALDVLVVLAYVRGRRERAVKLGLVLAAGAALQFAWAFTPWWGGSDPADAMIGTIYWHNQYAAFLYPGALLGAAVALRNERPWRFLGWVAFALGLAGVVYSTSRAELALLIASTAVVFAYAVARGPHRAALLRRSAGLVAAGSLVVVAMSTPPLVAHAHSPFAGEQARTAGQSLGTNGGYRVDFWHQAVLVWVHHPLLGAGYGELAYAAHGLVPGGSPSSPLAHEGFLQAFADGGLLLGLPLLLACVALVAAALRHLPRRIRTGDLIGVAAAVAFGGVLAHSAIDFDWSYPAVFAVGALVAGVAASGPARRDPSR